MHVLKSTIGFCFALVLLLGLSGITGCTPKADEGTTTKKLGEAPLGLPALAIPADNPMTPEKVELGKMLYFDGRLSKDGTISCATCHDPKAGWTERRATSKGINDQIGGRNSPSVINAAYNVAQFWDGRSPSLEDQALGPIENKIEMGEKLEDVVKKLKEVPEYVKMFKDAFGTEVNKPGIAKAIAAFERTILSGNSPYDKFKAGDETALSEEQKRGLTVFTDNCASCHKPPTFSNGRYTKGINSDKPDADEGRKAVTNKDADFHKIRVPQLREVKNTGPYFHDGSCETLEGAVATMASMVGVESDQEKNDLVAFLKALSGEYPIVDPPTLP